MADHTYFQDANTDSPKPKRKRTGKSCCVAACCGKNSDGVSIHGFPTNPSLRRQWINFVKTCRADFTAPTANSVICEKHFSADCYPPQYRLREEMGIRVTKKDLLPGSVPTIQKRFTPATSSNGSTIGTDSTVTSVASHSQTCTAVTTTRKRPVTSKPRTAYAKREHQRVLSEMLAATDMGVCSQQRNVPPGSRARWTRYICSKHFVGGNGLTEKNPDPLPAHHTKEHHFRDGKPTKQYPHPTPYEGTPVVRCRQRKRVVPSDGKPAEQRPCTQGRQRKRGPRQRKRGPSEEIASCVSAKQQKADGKKGDADQSSEGSRLLAAAARIQTLEDRIRQLEEANKLLQAENACLRTLVHHVNEPRLYMRRMDPAGMSDFKIEIDMAGEPILENTEVESAELGHEDDSHHGDHIDRVTHNCHRIKLEADVPDRVKADIVNTCMTETDGLQVKQETVSVTQGVLGYGVSVDSDHGDHTDRVTHKNCRIKLEADVPDRVKADTVNTCMTETDGLQVKQETVSVTQGVLGYGVSVDSDHGGHTDRVTHNNCHHIKLEADIPDTVKADTVNTCMTETDGLQAKQETVSVTQGVLGYGVSVDSETKPPLNIKQEPDV